MSDTQSRKLVVRQAKIPSDLDDELRELVPSEMESIGRVSRRVVFAVREYVRIRTNGAGGPLPLRSQMPVSAGAADPSSLTRAAPPGDAPADPGARGED